MRFAQIIDGRVTNPVDGPDVETALAKAFSAAWVDGQSKFHAWISVPADTVANSTWNGSGWVAPEHDSTPVLAQPADDVGVRLDALAGSIQKIADHLGVEL